MEQQDINSMLSHVSRPFATEVDVTAVEQILGFDLEERALHAKTVAEFLLGLHEVELLQPAAERVECLYWKATTGNYAFRHEAVDTFAAGVLIALEQHPDRPTALSIAAHLRRGRGVSQNKYISDPPELRDIGLQPARPSVDNQGITE